MPSPFPFGMRNAATYASSSSTNFAEYEDLPGHHLLSIRNLVASSPDEPYPETASSIADDISFFLDNFTAEEAEDYSGVRDPDAFRSFQLAAAYCLTCSEDSSEGDYDPTRECFMAELADGAVTRPKLHPSVRAGFVRLPFKPSSFIEAEPTARNFVIGVTKTYCDARGATGTMGIPVPPGATRLKTVVIAGAINTGARVAR